LLKYEAEILTQVGAWKSLEELEDSLILHEMFLLYRACAYHFSKDVKGSAAAFGGEVDWDDDWYNPEPSTKAQDVIRAWDIPQMAIGLGYESGI
jgi:hypothetical protein